MSGESHDLPISRCLYATYTAGNNKETNTITIVADRPMHAVVGGLGGCELEVDMMTW